MSPRRPSSNWSDRSRRSQGFTFGQGRGEEKTEEEEGKEEGEWEHSGGSEDEPEEESCDKMYVCDGCLEDSFTHDFVANVILADGELRILNCPVCQEQKTAGDWLKKEWCDDCLAKIDRES